MRMSGSDNVRRKTLDVRRKTLLDVRRRRVFLLLTAHISRLTVSFVFLLLTAYGLLLTEVMADEFHYTNILVGDRAAGMGGAYTAISDDPSGCYYNPAGIVYATSRSLSVSVNAFQYTQTDYKDVLGGNGWVRYSSNLLPNYFGIIQPLGAGKIGFSYAVPDSRDGNQAQTFYNFPGSNPYNRKEEFTITSWVFNDNDIDNTYNFGPSYALKITDNVSIGTTLYLHYRNRKAINNQLITFPTANGSYQWQNAYITKSEGGLRPVLGIMWTPMNKMSVGLSISKTYLLDLIDQLGNRRGIQLTWRDPFRLSDPRDLSSDKICRDAPCYTNATSKDKRQFPVATTLGIAYFPSERFLISTDISYYTPVSYDITYKTERTIGGQTYSDLETLSFEQKPVLNVAIGAEYYLNEKLAVRGGLFTNKANTPEISPNNQNTDDHVDLNGVSLSITTFTRSSSLTFGGAYSFGTGDSRPSSANIKTVEEKKVTAFISGSYSY